MARVHRWVTSYFLPTVTGIEFVAIDLLDEDPPPPGSTLIRAMLWTHLWADVSGGFVPTPYLRSGLLVGEEPPDTALTSTIGSRDWVGMSEQVGREWVDQLDDPTITTDGNGGLPVIDVRSPRTLQPGESLWLCVQLSYFTFNSSWNLNALHRSLWLLPAEV